ncbi:MAG TPA: phosphoribosyltransferase family protein [Pyrinomonadaceae bacterium]|nr:phosphoribosyltransferase family protein [Pyrinomonadaceae bacterium]
MKTPDTDADSLRRAARFTDLYSAGRDLASKLGEYAGREDTVVLALARGGVPVAAEVAKRLRAPLDVVIIRRLLVPRGPDAPVCALSVGGALFLDEELPPRPEMPASALDFFIADALDELARRERICRGARPPVALAGKTVLLIDNGIRTGSTMRAAVRALRASAPARVIAAVPVAAPESRASVEAVADELVCLAFPSPFGHVGIWYADFERPGDEWIRAMLEEAARGDDERERAM